VVYEGRCQYISLTTDVRQYFSMGAMLKLCRFDDDLWMVKSVQ
jgi:hypothetical protein